MSSVVDIGLGVLRVFTAPSQAVYWGYLLSAAVIAGIVYFARTGKPSSWSTVLRDLVPLRLLAHRSVRNDVGLFVVNTLLHSFFFVVPLQAVSSAVARWTWAGLHAMTGPHEPWLSGWPLKVVATLAIFAMADLAFYVAHRLLHRIPWLWALHKVHHSAEVLNPLTVMRRHPGDILFDGLVSGLVMGVTYGVLGFVAGQIVPGYAILGVNAILFVTLTIGFNLQHSHVWLRFGAMDRLLISPAAHQLHHSDAEAHYDCNFGNMLSVWDRLANTYLAPPRRPPPLSFGLGPETERYRSVWRLLLVPLAEIFFGNAAGAGGTNNDDEDPPRSDLPSRVERSRLHDVGR